jgi:lysozyme
MKYSTQGLALTESFEGCRLEAYQDQVGVWTIGYGHTRGVFMGDHCTQLQAQEWLMQDIAACENDVNTHVKVPLTQGEFDALVDFAFNLGCASLNGSTLLRLLNAGDYHGASEEFEKWDHAGGKVVAGLLRRRLAEEAEFNGAA